MPVTVAAVSSTYGPEPIGVVAASALVESSPLRRPARVAGQVVEHRGVGSIEGDDDRRVIGRLEASVTPAK